MKTGRPKGPEKVVVKLRLTPSQKRTLDQIMPRLKEGGVSREEAEVLMAVPAQWDTTPQAAPQMAVKAKELPNALNVAPSKEAHDAIQYPTEISQLKAEKAQLWESNDKLMKDLERARSEIPSSDNELVLLWKSKALEAQALVKKYEQERYG